MFLFKASDIFKAVAACLSILAPYILAWLKTIDNEFVNILEEPDRPKFLQAVEELFKHLV